MIVTIKELLEAAPTLQELDGRPVAGTMSTADAFTLGTIISAVNPHLQTYSAVRNKVLSTKADPQEGQKDVFKFKGEAEQAEFIAADEQLQMQVVTLRSPRLTLAQVEAWKLSALQLVSLGFLIKDRPVVEIED